MSIFFNNGHYNCGTSEWGLEYNCGTSDWELKSWSIFDLDGVADYEHNEVYTKVVWEKFKRNSIQVLKLFPETSIYFYTKIY